MLLAPIFLATAVLSAASPSTLHEAVQRNDIGALEILIEDGADLEDRLEERTPLALAAADAEPEVIKLLLEAGAEVDAFGPGATTPLMRAAYYGNTQAVKLLLDHGASVIAEAQSGYAPFDYALEGGHEDILRILLKTLAVTATAQELHSLKLLNRVLDNDEPSLLRDLQSDHANHHNATGYAALPLAVRLNRATLVNALLSHGADPNIGNDGNDEAGPLHQAARGGHTRLVEQLLHAGARVDKPNARGYTPLILATLYNQPDIVQILVKHGADPKRTNDDGQTALSIAKERDDAALITLLDNSEPARDLPHLLRPTSGD